MSNIILIGFMGCGKSSIGRRLSYRLQRTMLDTDKEIERKNGMEISQIFAEYGEKAFRDMETEYIKGLIGNCNNQIISTGGGLPLREENRKLLQKLGCTVYLEVSAEAVYYRLKNDTTRPLLQGENPLDKIQTLLRERKDIYEAAADVKIDVNDRDYNDILNEIQEAVKKYENTGN